MTTTDLTDMVEAHIIRSADPDAVSAEIQHACVAAVRRRSGVLRMVNPDDMLPAELRSVHPTAEEARAAMADGEAVFPLHELETGDGVRPRVGDRCRRITRGRWA